MTSSKAVSIPDYVEVNYWWAYVRPWAASIFDHQWAVNLILLGNYNRMRNEALEEIGLHVSGRTLQVGCCYGDLTPHLAARAAQSGGSIDVIDVLPIQLEHLRRKLLPGSPVNAECMDAAVLNMADSSYDSVLIFFLIHEQPKFYRERTMSEALRVLKLGGKIVIIDYAQPTRWHLARFTSIPLYSRLKPCAIEVWNHEMSDLIPEQMAGRTWSKTSYFGGLFQKLVSIK